MAFKKGQSGKPLGRPKRVFKEADYRKALNEALRQTLPVLIKMALSGDVQAHKIIMDRAIPACKPIAEPITFDYTTSDTKDSIAQLIIDNMALGEL